MSPSDTIINPLNKQSSIVKQHTSKSYLDDIPDTADITIDGSLHDDYHGYWILYKIRDNNTIIGYFSFREHKNRQIKQIHSQEHYEKRLQTLEQNKKAKKTFS